MDRGRSRLASIGLRRNSADGIASDHAQREKNRSGADASTNQAGNSQRSNRAGRGDSGGVRVGAVKILESRQWIPASSCATFRSTRLRMVRREGLEPPTA